MIVNKDSFLTMEEDSVFLMIFYKIAISLQAQQVVDSVMKIKF